MKRVRVLNLGAGIQSTAIALMIHKGEIDPIDAAIFADTGWESKATMRHLDWLENEVRGSFPVHRVTSSMPPNISGDIRADVLRVAEMVKKGEAPPKGRTPQPPLFTSSEKNGRGILFRTCTETYKVVPLKRFIREMLGFKKGERVKGAHVDQLFGISFDEMQRMRISQDKWSTFVYPLIDLQMSRQSCRKWIHEKEYPMPPRSACIGCPFRRNREWAEMKKERPEEWAEAVEFDEAVRGGLPRTREALFVHESLTPLGAIDFDSQQEFSFNDECGGYCGV